LKINGSWSKVSPILFLENGKNQKIVGLTHATNFYKSLFGSSHPSHLRPLAATSRAAASTSSRSKAEQQGSYLANSVLVAPLRVA